MALKIRLRQQGRTNRQSYRLVVADVRSPRDGKYIEMLGWYNPFNAEQDMVAVDVERVNYWLSQGAQLSEQAVCVISKVAPQVIKDFNAKLTARRVKETKERRERNKKTA